jgi:hypothetical protein
MRILLASILFLFSSAFPGDKGGPFMKHDKESLQSLKAEVGLTDEQMKKLEVLKLDAVKIAEVSRHAIDMEKIALKEAGLKGTLTKARIKESLKKIQAETGKMHDARFQAALSAIDVFTEEQIKKMSDKKLLGLLIHIRDEKGPGAPGGPACPHKDKMK